MGHYEKLAIIAFRVVGVSVCILGLVSTAYALIISRPASIFDALVGAFSALFYVALGILLYVLSKLLAALTVKGLGR
jgi:hypothetical protein